MIIHSMRRSGGMSMIAAMLAMSGGMPGLPGVSSGTPFTPTVDSQEEKDAKQAKVNRAKGLKEFRFGGKLIWARDLKNAQRKAKNLGLDADL